MTAATHHAPALTDSARLRQGYAACREIARREARNFYWAFTVLPRAKSDAMCAVYAFMRRADDLADDETMTLEERRVAMAGWTAAWHASRDGNSEDPVFIALLDTQQRFGIADDLLEQLVAGTTLDLQPQPAGTTRLQLADASGGAGSTLLIWDTQASLEQYCYLVASVVGLVCIRIFGYSDASAERLAIDTGKAFQLTNVLRDVREDAERGRVYLPQSTLDTYGVTPARLLELTSAAGVTATATPAECAMLGSVGERAQQLYRSADSLIPLLDADARGAMRVLATIYHRLLLRTLDPAGITFRERVAVPTSAKLAILLRGLVESGIGRLRA